MSWASRRRFLFLFGIILFFTILIGTPLLMWWYEPATCFDGIQNQGESAVDKSGPCKLLDQRTLTPHAIQWARAFPVRDGSWSAVAYIENPNDEAGVMAVPYKFKLYDDRNVLITDRESVTYVMPGSVTPIYAGGFETGNRRVARTFFEFSAPLVWERLSDASRPISVTGKAVRDPGTTPRVTAVAENTSVRELRDVGFVVSVFDTGGNAIATSQTVVLVMSPGERHELIFTWTEPFPSASGRIDVLPLLPPEDFE